MQAPDNKINNPFDRKISPPTVIAIIGFLLLFVTFLHYEAIIGKSAYVGQGAQHPESFAQGIPAPLVAPIKKAILQFKSSNIKSQTP